MRSLVLFTIIYTVTVSAFSPCLRIGLFQQQHVRGARTSIPGCIISDASRNGDNAGLNPGEVDEEGEELVSLAESTSCGRRGRVRRWLLRLRNRRALTALCCASSAAVVVPPALQLSPAPPLVASAPAVSPTSSSSSAVDRAVTSRPLRRIRLMTPSRSLAGYSSATSSTSTGGGRAIVSDEETAVREAGLDWRRPQQQPPPALATAAPPQQQQQQQHETPPPPSPPPQEEERQSTSFVSRAVREVGPAVVLINTEHSSYPGLASGGVGGGSSNPYGASPSAPPQRVGQGSGFIFDTEGLVLTNAHVVKGCSGLTVTLRDGTRHKGSVLGTDPFSDLAVVKILTDDNDANANAPTASSTDVSKSSPPAAPASSSSASSSSSSSSSSQRPHRKRAAPKEKQGKKKASTARKSFPVARLGDSDKLQAGDWVIAIGSPFGLDNTVTLGICSNPGRSIVKMDAGIDMKGTLIQTDAAINPGNSGGPLVSEFGEIVGINTMMRRHANSIGFAVPINRAKAIIEDLTQGRAVQWGFLGIEHRNISPELARAWNGDVNGDWHGPDDVPETHGTIVMKVEPRSAAALAGLKRFDVITGANGRVVESVDDLTVAVDSTPVGGRLLLTVQRGGKILELEAHPQDLGKFRAEKEEEQRRQLEQEERERKERMEQDPHGSDDGDDIGGYGYRPGPPMIIIPGFPPLPAG